MVRKRFHERTTKQKKGEVFERCFTFPTLLKRLLRLQQFARDVVDLREVSKVSSRIRTVQFEIIFGTDCLDTNGLAWSIPSRH